MKTVIEMARETGMVVVEDQYSLLPFIERFAALVAAAEREACAKVADGYIGADPIAEAIRARGNT